MHDVVIVGGGCIGCATAVHLLTADPGLDVVVLEPDPTYANAASAVATGGIRQLFTLPENILLSRYTLDVIGSWAEFTNVGGHSDPADLAWKQNGYLFIAAPNETASLASNFATQRGHGVEAEWLEPAGVHERFPHLHTGDLGAAVYSPRDGWLDPHAFLHGLRRTAANLGARFRAERAVRLPVNRAQVRGVVLESGNELPAHAVVNCAGTAAPELAATAGMPVPVEAMPRLEHYIDVPGDFSTLPFIKDPEGLAVRPEGAGLSVGLVDFSRTTGLDPSVDRHHFDETVWPALAHRFPTLDTLRHRSTWSGHYDQNRLDGNMILGNWPGHVDNLYLATGFSGHGLMHAPGVGRALAELIIHDEFRTIDLTRLGYQRVPDGHAYPEVGIR